MFSDCFFFITMFAASLTIMVGVVAVAACIYDVFIGCRFAYRQKQTMKYIQKVLNHV